MGFFKETETYILKGENINKQYGGLGAEKGLNFGRSGWLWRLWKKGTKKGALKRLNCEHFGNIQRNIAMVEQRLNALDLKEEVGGLSQNIDGFLGGSNGHEVTLFS